MKLFTGIKASAGRGMLKIKAKSPEILVVAGVIGVVTSTVMACKATRKLDAVLEEHNANVNEIKAFVNEHGYSEKYNESDERHDICLAYRDTTIKMIKMYAPSVLLGVVSIGCIFQSHRILKSRLVTMSSLYNATEKAFSAYRKRVAEKLGAEEERKLRYDLKPEEVEVEQENGKKKKTFVDTVDPNLNMYSPYARFFDENSPMWDKNPEYNRLFLTSQQQIANDMLIARGYLFLNDIYDMLGFQKTEAGQRVGWIYDAENPIGDNFVDFGMYDLYERKGHDFVNGYNPSILLDFNVDGDILTMAFADKI